MLSGDITQLVVAHPVVSHLVSLTISVWLTYLCVIKHGGFVSDDLQGIAEYDGKLQGREYGMVSRWVRYHLCGGNFPSGDSVTTPDNRKLSIPCGKIPWRHHALSVVVFNLSIIVTYFFLAPIIGNTLSFLTLLLFSVHPVCTQIVAWCSGIGYPLSLLWMSLSAILARWYYQSDKDLFTTIWTLGLFAILQYLGINALFIGLMLWPILVFLGYYEFAAVSFLISIVLGLQIVKHTIGIRVSAFKEQEMAHSTIPNWRKVIVATKTLGYYIKHALLPMQMGLYHEWGYHYNKNLERENKLFFVSLLAVLSMSYVFLTTDILPIRLGILWFVSFLFIFLNWITIQQFVTERYVAIPSIGFCMIIAYFTQSYLPIFFLLYGLYLMRTWMHLPTYDDELRFYESNVWNFKKSEVAYGNLGVTHLRFGRIMTAIDDWHHAINVNPQYDVPYYNIYSHYKSNALNAINNGNYQYGVDLLKQSYPYLDKARSCEICHFRVQWTKELEEVAEWIKNPLTIVHKEKERLEKLQVDLDKMLVEAKDDKRKQEISSSIVDCNLRLKHIETMLSKNETFKT